MTPHIEKRRTCLAYSAGGHYTELTKAIEGITFEDIYHITFYTPRFDNDKTTDRIFLVHPRKKIIRSLLNATQSLWFILAKRPKLIISTGADVAAATIIFGKIFTGCTVIFVESGGNLTPTLTGRMVYRFTDLFIVQWEEQLKFYPKAKLSKGLLL